MPGRVINYLIQRVCSKKPPTLAYLARRIWPGISGPGVSGAIVPNVNCYFRRTQISTWERLTAKMGGKNAVAG